MDKYRNAQAASSPRPKETKKKEKPQRERFIEAAAATGVTSSDFERAVSAVLKRRPKDR